MDFPYAPEQTYFGLLSIEDIGQCALVASKDDEAEYYLVIKTTLGESSIMEYGPIVPDIPLLPKKVSCAFDRIDYSEDQLIKRITKFLSGKTQAGQVPEEEVYSNCVDIIGYMRDHSKEANY